LATHACSEIDAIAGFPFPVAIGKGDASPILGTFRHIFAAVVVRNGQYFAIGIFQIVGRPEIGIANVRKLLGGSTRSGFRGDPISRAVAFALSTTIGKVDGTTRSGSWKVAADDFGVRKGIGNVALARHGGTIVLGHLQDIRIRPTQIFAVVSDWQTAIGTFDLIVEFGIAKTRPFRGCSTRTHGLQKVEIGQAGSVIDHD
jgi:hypothetical protein